MKNQSSESEYFLNASTTHAGLGKIGPIRHNYHLHPLLQIPRLAELAKSLFETEQCRFLLPGSTIKSSFHHESKSPDGRDIDTVFADIERPGSWVALYNVQTNSLYRQLLWEIINNAKKVLVQDQNIYDARGFIFISAPPSVTPLHIDRENNFWLQIHGRKTINVWNNDDSVLVPPRRREEFLMYGGADIEFHDGDLARSHEFDCGPGDGVFFPMTSPHMTRSSNDWVQAGNRVTASIGVVFYSDQTRRTANIHVANHYLRRTFMREPGSPQLNGLTSTLKYSAGKLILTSKKLGGGYKVPPGF